MKTYIVFVTFKQEQAAGAFRQVRYVDSQWASEAHADQRKAELGESLSMGHARDWVITIHTGIIADATIAGESERGSDKPEPAK